MIEGTLGSLQNVGKTEEDAPLEPSPDDVLAQRYLKDRAGYQPWRPRSDGDAGQEAMREVLRHHAGATSFGKNAFISPEAMIHTDRFSIGANSWIASGAIVRGRVSIGSNSTLNSYAHVAGRVTIGNGVRIAGQAAIYGFNHGFERTDIPIHQQTQTSKGVVIGDGSWVGANAVILDGVSLGRDCIVAAGAVVTKSFGDFSIVGGNPARLIKTRGEPAAPETAVRRERPDHLRVRAMLYDEDPYADLPFSFPPDLQGWDSKHPIFGELIGELRPSLIVEVGTWKGASAVHMAKLCRKLGLATEIVCIDTWLGNWQHWSRETGVGSKLDLRIVNAFPRLYYQFMANVLHFDCADSITPLPLTGVAGAKLFKHLEIQPEIIYIDGDHEYESVLFDLRLWLDQLKPGGAIIGDDYNWPGVRRAVEEIMKEDTVRFDLHDRKFVLRRK